MSYGAVACALVCERLRCEPWRPWGWGETTRRPRRPARRGESGKQVTHQRVDVATPPFSPSERRRSGQGAPMQYDCFLTHDWGEDEEGRSNHARVGKLCAALKAEGIRPWFDEECMRGDINDKMVDGIERSGAVVCFITDRYLEKAWGKGANGHNDNCKFEFDYSLRRKGVEAMIPVVMEKRCRNPSDWAGTVGGKLGGKLYIDLSSDDSSAFDSGVKQLAAEIRVVLESGRIRSGVAGGNKPGHPMAPATAPKAGTMERKPDAPAVDTIPAGELAGCWCMTWWCFLLTVTHPTDSTDEVEFWTTPFWPPIAIGFRQVPATNRWEGVGGCAGCARIFSCGKPALLVFDSSSSGHDESGCPITKLC